MAYPVVKVEIAFTQGPYVASPTWTDITTYVRDISIRRGRTDEFQDFDAGTASLTLDNRSRLFDPTYTAGTYYGNLVPRRQIKIIATNNSTVYPVYRGYITGWPMSITEAGFDATVTLECYDAFGLLANEELPDDLADYGIRNSGTVHYYPLTDPIDPTNYTSQTLLDFGRRPVPLTLGAGVRTSNAPGLTPGLSNTCESISDTNNQNGWSMSGTAQFVGTYQSFSQWFMLGNGDPTNQYFASYGISHNVDLRYDRTNNILYIDTYYGSGGVTATLKRVYAGTAYIDITIPHQIIVVSNEVGQLESCSLDGIEVTFSAATTSTVSVSLQEKFSTMTGRHQQVAIWDSRFNWPMIKSLYQLSVGLLTESTSDRFNRLIGYTSFPLSLTSKSANLVATVSEISEGGPSVTSELQLLSDSEGGSLYVSKSGIVTLTARYDFTQGRSATTQATFGAGGIGIGTTIDYHLTSENMRNELTMGFSGNGSIDVTDSTSVAAYGTCGGSWPTQLSTQTDAQALGNLLLTFTKSPQFVISPYEVNVEASTASWDTVLGLELLDRILLNIPQKTGSNTAAIQLLQSIEHKITPSQWSTILNGSVRYTNIFVLGTSLLGGFDLLI